MRCLSRKWTKMEKAMEKARRHNNVPRKLKRKPWKES
jgi:hypothetical protein